MNRKALLIVLTLAVAVVFSACSSPSPTITITTAPPATLEINNSASIAATTTHDKGEGVDWSCAPAGSCGTLNPTHTDSGASTTYTAPSASGSVTITATSTKKATVSATSTVTITAVATEASLTGSYAFYLSGFDSANGGSFYAAAGSVTLDGAGNVSGGEEDLNDAAFGAPVVGDLLTGTYTVGDDGQGTMILNATAGGVADPNVGVGGLQTLAFTVVNSNHILITEFDSAFTSGGSLDLQDPTAITGGFVGNFAFTAAGFLSGEPVTFGGILNTTGTSSTGTADENAAGSVATAIVTGGAVTAPDASGRGTFVLGSLNFAYYIVGAEAVRFTEIDTGGATSGSAFGQGSTPAFNAASVTGPFVITQPFSFDAAGAVALGGQFTSDGVSAITGVVDYNDDGLVPAGPGPDTLTASYAVPAVNGYGSISGGVVSGDPNFTTYGLYLTDPAINLSDPNNSSGGGGALVIELDVTTLGQGLVAPQTSTSLAAGNNAINFTGANFGTTGGPTNTNGQVLSDGSSTLTGSGSVNVFDIGGATQSTTSGNSLAGAVTADSANAGRFTMALTVAGGTPLNWVLYQASSGLTVHVDVDGGTGNITLGTGVIESQQ